MIKNIGRFTLIAVCTFGNMQLHSMNADINALDENGDTQLHRAFLDQDISKVESLLEKGADPSIPNREDWTFIDLVTSSVFEGEKDKSAAFKSMQLDIAKILFSPQYHDKFDPNRQHKVAWIGYTPLHYAIWHKQVEMVQLILSHPKIDPNRGIYEWGAYSYEDDTPLHLAIKVESLEILNLLLAHKKIKPNKPNNSGVTPLYKATNNNLPVFVQILLDHYKTTVDSDAITYTVQKNKPDMLKFLLDHMRQKDRDINTIKIHEDWPDRTMSLLHEAVIEKNFIIVDILFKYGASTTIADSNNLTPLDYLTYQETTGLISHRDQDTTRAIKNILLTPYTNRNLTYVPSKNIQNNQLLAKIYPINKQDLDGNTPLHQSIVERGHKLVPTSERTQALIAAGANVNLLNKEGDTPLLIAARLSNNEAIALLVKCENIQLNVRQAKDGNTALHLAVFYHNTSGVKLLIDAGASRSLINNDSKNPWTLTSLLKDSDEGMATLYNLFQEADNPTLVRPVDTTLLPAISIDDKNQPNPRSSPLLPANPSDKNKTPNFGKNSNIPVLNFSINPLIGAGIITAAASGIYLMYKKYWTHNSSKEATAEQAKKIDAKKQDAQERAPQSAPKKHIA